MYNFNSIQNNYWFSVNGYEDAKNFNVAPSQTVLLIDTQQPFMYMKNSNQMGQSTIKTYKIEEMPSNPEKMAQNDLFKAFDERLSKIESLLISKGENNNV